LPYPLSCHTLGTASLSQPDESYSGASNPSGLPRVPMTHLKSQSPSRLRLYGVAPRSAALSALSYGSHSSCPRLFINAYFFGITAFAQ
jgi:hypothetical protein